MLLCVVALQNSGLLVMLRRLDLVLEENSERKIIHVISSSEIMSTEMSHIQENMDIVL